MSVPRGEAGSRPPGEAPLEASPETVQGRDSCPPVIVVDAGVGNLGNMRRALERHGASATVTADPAAIAAATCLVLPGVGAFRPPREALRGLLEDALRSALRRGAWLLGVCVGYQMLFESSEEFGTTAGLSLLPGRVTRLPASVALPHIGWNRLRLAQPEHPLVADLAEGGYAYFVHSFAPQDVPADAVVAWCQHGRRFPAIVARGRVLGTQFHPEKSGELGLRVLAAFLRLATGGRLGTVAGD